MTEAAWVQAISTVVLVLITAYYACQASKQAEKTSDQAEQARRSAEASERSLEFLTAEQRKESILDLHELHEKLRRFARTAEKKLAGTIGNPSEDDLYNRKLMQELRGIAVRIGGTAGQEAMKAMRLTDKVNKRKEDCADEPNKKNKAAYRDALEAARTALRTAEKEADQRLVAFLEEGPHPPVPDIRSDGS